MALIKGLQMKNRLSIIDTLASARKAQGLTQEEWALKAGTSRVTVGRVESGFDPKLATVHELARALGLELLLVPKVLAGEVQAFIQSGGRVLAQPSGAGAPDSVVTQALSVSNAIHRRRGALDKELQPPHSARSPARHRNDRAQEARAPTAYSERSAKSGVQEGMPARITEGEIPPTSAFASSKPQEAFKGPGISAAALARLRSTAPSKGKP